MTDRRKLFFAGLALLMTGLLVSCQARATPTLAALSQPGIGVGISDDICPSFSVQVGQLISWTNQGNREHIVRDTTIEGQSQFDSGTLQPGGSFEVTGLQPQTYQYECSADGSLKGTFTVEP